jgi:membrane fusion protein, copper/silver efflux system
METPAKVAGVLALAVAAFLGGTWYARRETPTTAREVVPKVLYYACPMHPKYRSGKPGNCLSCGMRLEAVYVDGDGRAADVQPAGGLASMSGAIRVPLAAQQTIGVRLARVARASVSQTMRVSGRVSADETRIHKVIAAADGLTREIKSTTTGSLVRNGEMLASFYAPEFQGAQQAYLFALSSMDRFHAGGSETQSQIELTEANIQQARDTLLVLGMGEPQIDEISRTRQLSQNIWLTAPVAGFVILRNLSPGQRFEKGTELYRIADLSRVWVLADLFEDEAEYVRPGQSVTVHYRRKTFTAKASEVLPQFDPATRTLKARFETENPDYALRPDMFVDVELPVSRPPAISVPVDAVIDSGMKKTVFVANGNGYFEPRAVETGWRFGGQVEIVKGLVAGEQIVVSGTFLIDSESRLRAAAEIASPAKLTDPVCGMDVDPATAGNRKSTHQGKTYYFCTDECKRKFDQNPESYLKQAANPQRH